jgi:Tol biopolymer transport system component
MLRNEGLRRATAIATALLVALVVMLVMWEARPAEAAFPGTPGAIVFTKNLQIYRMDADGFRQTLISDTTRAYKFPSWSANGKEIVFQRITETTSGTNEDIYTRSFDGTNQQNLTNAPSFHDEQPVFSKDGTKVFFVRAPTGGGTTDIFMLNRTQLSSPPVQITDTPTFNENSPAVSPDGTKLAFTSNRSGDPEIYVMKAAAEGSTNVAKKLTKATSGSSVLDTDGAPEWSPSGTQIAFASFRTGDAEIFRMKAAPEGRRNRPVNLTKNASTLDLDPAWSPDGRKIAFTSNGTPGDREIFSMDATNGANKANLTNDPANTENTPDWQPLP